MIVSVILTGIIRLDDGGQLLPTSDAPTQWHFLSTFAQLLVLSLVLLHFNFALFRRLTDRPMARRTAVRTFVWAVCGSLVVGGIPSVVLTAMGIRTGVSLVQDGLVALTVILITVLLYNLTRHQQQILEEERTHSESIRTRYDALERQIDPHFLFNSLNTLDGLIGYDDGRAHDYLHQLATSYRYIMQQQRCVMVADEMHFTDNFIAMMQLRYGSGLRVSTQVDPRCLSAWVVPISVQLLVENALQHNIASDRHPLAVSITTVERPNPTGSDKPVCYSLRVSNPLQPKPDSGPDSHGSIGLSNLSERCRLILHRDIVISQTSDTFSVEIPIKLKININN